MKAMVINEFGAGSVFQAVELPKPEVTPGHVLIKVAATSVNPLDYKIRSGMYSHLVSNFPMILQGDISGTVEAVGADVNTFAVGDKVYGCVGGLRNMAGGLAEYVVADANLIAKAPQSLSLQAASALPLVALTAWEALVNYTQLQKDQTILIHGSTGGVGHIAIQLAKYLGAKVFATASSEEKLALGLQLGADVAINYVTTDVATYVAKHTAGRGFDIVFDTVGGKNLEACFNAVCLYGKVVTISGAGTHDLTAGYSKGMTLCCVLQPLPLLTGQGRERYGAILKEFAQLVDRSVIKPLIDATPFPLEQVGAAHDYLESGKALGKVVIQVS